MFSFKSISFNFDNISCYTCLSKKCLTKVYGFISITLKCSEYVRCTYTKEMSQVSNANKYTDMSTNICIHIFRDGIN